MNIKMSLSKLNLEKALLVAFLCFVFAFVVTNVWAAMTLNSTSITSDGSLTVAPGADFSLTQNLVTPFVSESAGAVANTLHLKEGIVGIGGEPIIGQGLKLNVFGGDFDAIGWTGSDPEILLGFFGQTNIGTNAGYFALSDNGVETVSIPANGNSYFNGGSVGIGTELPSAALDISSDSFILEIPRTPTSATAACDQGEISWDANFVYVCVATNTWKRSAIATW